MTDDGVRSTIVLENRERLTVGGVTEITAFTEDRIDLDTCMGHLCIRGRGLTVTDLSSETGEVSASFDMDDFELTTTGRTKGKKSFREKVFG